MTYKGCAARMEYRGRTKNAMTSKGCAARMEYRGRTKNAMTSKGYAARMEYRGRIMNAMTYKGCAARVEYSDEDQCFVGHIAGIRDCIGFHSESVAGLRKAFKEAVKDYLETCAAVGKTPQKPYPEKLTLRLSPESRASVPHAAQLGGQSTNQWSSGALSRVVHTLITGLRRGANLFQSRREKANTSSPVL